MEVGGSVRGSPTRPRARTPEATLSLGGSRPSGERRLALNSHGPLDSIPPEKLRYEPPAVIFEQKIEAVANTCNFDPPTTKSNAGEGCTGLTFS